MKKRLEVPLGDETYSFEMGEKRSIEGGKKAWAARCRVPVSGKLALRNIKCVKPDSDFSARAAVAGTTESNYSQIILEGTASSTSVDWHGTEMTRDALEHMMEQFKKGVPYVPSHMDDEWNDVFGQTFDAEMIAETVRRPGDNPDQPAAGLALRVKTTLDKDHPMSKRLVNAVDSGRVIGWSIGGWFTDMEFIMSDEDEIERILIMGVDLDHLATTRRPSNPDSWITEIQRSMSSQIEKEEVVAEAPILEEPAIEERHIKEVIETEEDVIIRFGKSGEWDGLKVQDHDEDHDEDNYEDEVEDMERARYDGINFSPPKGVRAECQRGLDWKAEGFDGSGEAAIRWARKLAQGEDITPDKARRMKSYLARHEVDKQGKGFTPDEDGYPSSGRVAWALWGGDPAVGWCAKLVRQMNAADEERVEKEPLEYKKERSNITENLDTTESMCQESVTDFDAQRSDTPIKEILPITKLREHKMSNVKEETEVSASEVTPTPVERSTDRLDRLENALETLVELQVRSMQKPEPVVEAVAEPSEADTLRARLVEIEEKMARMAEKPVRAGTAHTPEKAARAIPSYGLSGFVARAEEVLGSETALVNVCKGQAERRDAIKSELPSRDSLERDLRTVLHAALQDGVIIDPDTRTTWSN